MSTFGTMHSQWCMPEKNKEIIHLISTTTFCDNGTHQFWPGEHAGWLSNIFDVMSGWLKDSESFDSFWWVAAEHWRRPVIAVISCGVWRPYLPLHRTFQWPQTQCNRDHTCCQLTAIMDSIKIKIQADQGRSGIFIDSITGSGKLCKTCSQSGRPSDQACRSLVLSLCVCPLSTHLHVVFTALTVSWYQRSPCLGKL